MSLYTHTIHRDTEDASGILTRRVWMFELKWPNICFCEYQEQIKHPGKRKFIPQVGACYVSSRAREFPRTIPMHDVVIPDDVRKEVLDHYRYILLEKLAFQD